MVDLLKVAKTLLNLGNELLADLPSSATTVSIPGTSAAKNETSADQVEANRPRLDQAKAFLEGLIEFEPMPSNEIFAEGSKYGFGKKLLYEASIAMRLRKFPQRSANGKEWFWALTKEGEPCGIQAKPVSIFEAKKQEIDKWIKTLPYQYQDNARATKYQEIGLNPDGSPLQSQKGALNYGLSDS